MVEVIRKRYSHIGKPHLYGAQRGRCFYCGKFMAGRKATRDHLVPRCKGTTLNLNMVVCCEPCNLKKGCRMPTQREMDKARAIYASMGIPAFAIRG